MSKKNLKIIDYYECPGCGYRISEIEFISARVNLPCPSRPSSIYGNKFNWCQYTHKDYKVVYKTEELK